MTAKLSSRSTKSRSRSPLSIQIIANDCANTAVLWHAPNHSKCWILNDVILQDDAVCLGVDVVLQEVSNGTVTEYVVTFQKEVS
ncbi:MAG: hypothetical protein M2R45_02800 [Verrucomicrobia subdivision 3 bacterium]|nr:hypothetical protein [Limisphaerales bacterium]MCS1414352.1 hypothetical protein [Limisphaerales bacterium]